ncbi:MAG TPA: aspartate carbamoyltransferase [Gammaproteobacteria bacterium]|nr:aspartate carbamoyltransferase [Gammaproteobacteria bacterium]
MEKLAARLDERPLDLRGFDRPRLLLDTIVEDLKPLLELVKRPVVSARQFNHEQLLQLCRLAARFETQPQLITRPLTGKLLVSAFYEPSTRTRLSFESAWHRLGGDIMSITDATSTGIAKGESYADVAQMLNSYGDMIVLRDSNAESIYEMLDVLRIPIINGGNGCDEHPTQALADVYAMLKWNPVAFTRPSPSTALRLGVIGIPSRMRTVRSLLLLLRHFAASLAEIVIITDDVDPFEPDQLGELEEAGLTIRVTDQFEKELPKLDIVYQNAILWVGDNYESVGEKFVLDSKAPLKPSAIVLHPLARGPELSPELDATAHNWYFAQAHGAVFVRMALLGTILKVFV